MDEEDSEKTAHHEVIADGQFLLPAATYINIIMSGYTAASS